MGVFPLVIAHGAEMRRTLAAAVFSGMIGVTLFGLILTPVFFYLIRHLAAKQQPAAAAPRDTGSDPGAEALATVSAQ